MEWDHLEGKAWLISAERAAARTRAVRERLLGPPAPPGTRLAPAPAPPQSNCSRAEFGRAVTRIREYIAAGDVYQVNLSQRFHPPFAGSPLELHRPLRTRH